MQTPPLIGLDAKRIVRNGTGLGSYGRTLVNDLAPMPFRLNLYAPDRGRDDLRRQVEGRANVQLCLPSHVFPIMGKALWRSKGIVSDLERDGVQVFHGLSGELPMGLRQHGIHSVVTIHDLIFMRHPEFYNWIDTKIYAWKFRQTIREADHIIAISECTKRDIMALGGVEESRISLIYQGCAHRFAATVAPEEQQAVSQHYGLPHRFILSVGSIEARKNMLLAVKALDKLPADIGLVIVGRHTAYTDTLTQYAQRHHLAHRIRILHGVPDDHLPALYAAAEVFVYPSFYEGFGIPIIEAIRQGLPVVACSGSCLEEAGGPDCLYVKPTDAEGLARAISQMLVGSEGREERIRRSQDYIRRFEGSNVASQVAAIYEKLLSKPMCNNKLCKEK